MKFKIEYEALPSDWNNLIVTIMDSGHYTHYWNESIEFQVRALITIDHPEIPGKKVRKGQWYAPRDISYGKDEVYAKREWRLVVTMADEDVGFNCFDGKTWGFRKGDKVRKQYFLKPEDFVRGSQKHPQVFLEWLESGDRNISTRFDAHDADTILQLACFGVCVFG